LYRDRNEPDGEQWVGATVLAVALAALYDNLPATAKAQVQRRDSSE
jgi:hypothetical protein